VLFLAACVALSERLKVWLGVMFLYFVSKNFGEKEQKLMKWEGEKSFSFGWSARLCTILITTSMQFHCRNDFIPSRNQDHSRFWAEAWECAFGTSQKQLISGNCCRICYHIYYQLTNFIKLTLLKQFKQREVNAISHMWWWLFASITSNHPFTIWICLILNRSTPTWIILHIQTGYFLSLYLKCGFQQINTH